MKEKQLWWWGEVGDTVLLSVFAGLGKKAKWWWWSLSPGVFLSFVAFFGEGGT
jgi:hypothetical protein